MSRICTVRRSYAACRGLVLLVAALLGGTFQSNAALIEEDFSSDPATRGWRVAGDASLFRWNSTSEALEVTWDSSRTNTYFHRSIGTVLGKDDSFSLSFDLRLSEIAVGVRPGQPFTFELAIGFLSLRDAIKGSFKRGTGSQSPNLVEFDYFPDSGFGATISPSIVSTNNQFIPSFSFPLELTKGDLFHVALNYSATGQTLKTIMTRNGEAFGPIKDVVLPNTFTDFRVDTLAISSYSDAGSDGSLLARGVIDRLVAVVPDPPIRKLTFGFVNRVWQIQFSGRSNWVYALERTADFVEWRVVSAVSLVSDGSAELRDDTPSARGFYRVRAERP